MMQNLRGNFLIQDSWKQKALDNAVKGLIARLGAEREEQVAQIILNSDVQSNPDSHIPEAK
ncbi:hypothetical protein K2X92_04290 [Candidatus Gracilibacteria bacterium]|nr:hypothetical protein [Candidatus Gracilibacteria bacterium]